MNAANHAHRPRKRFGQNFLRDPGYIDRVIAAIAPGVGDHCVEIGPGEGALTGPLARAAGRLDCIELDRDLARQLESRFAGRENVRVHRRDILQFDLAELGENPAGLRVVGNLPYNISTPVLFHLLKMSPLVTDMTFMLQREVVERMAAVPGGRNYGRLSVMLAYHCAVERLFHVPPEAFRPQPKVHSAVVRLRPHRPRPLRAVDDDGLAAVVRAAFGLRRKTLRNSLKSLAAPELLERLPLDPGARAEQLGVADYVRISDAIAAGGGK